jgi:Skp family chaperone for outer membrane proteins
MSEGCLHLRVILFILFIQVPVSMARTSNNSLTKGLRGQIGKQLVFKQYGKKTVVTRYPDMSKVVPSELQKAQRNGFAEAVAYAKSINNDSALRAKYAKKVKKGKSVFQYAIQEFLKGKNG